MNLNPEIWGPHYWFVLYTIAISYPINPNDVTKKKYYDFIQNLPVFIPMTPFGKDFIDMLDKYPVTPYLDSRLSFMKWIHFIFNKINEKLEKPQEDFYESLEKYYDEYKPKEIQDKEYAKTRKKYIDFGLCILIISGIIYLYKK